MSCMALCDSSKSGRQCVDQAATVCFELTWKNAIIYYVVNHFDRCSGKLSFEALYVELLCALCTGVAICAT